MRKPIPSELATMKMVVVDSKRRNHADSSRESAGAILETRGRSKHPFQSAPLRTNEMFNRGFLINMDNTYIELERDSFRLLFNRGRNVIEPRIPLVLLILVQSNKSPSPVLCNNEMIDKH
ncbi:hypothetical protein Pst134EA_032115 [Puccinia striiformis f. sp. tritici]|uniref:uncharacterized protein n=1 Tax=Puccinia striiformis f. sp. tritici TaxID=168172 RepID=UPI002007DCFF|nr:uncharacterized protein Pst134EA_032115 [Puccinia striiformis f. sp. tritici]KAH9441888.1 hypothetical protein Pst134EA_032115 [Puccinia striiformis f. sp. tritici]